MPKTAISQPSFSDLTDAELIVRMTHADQDALAELYDRYAAMLLAWAGRWAASTTPVEDLIHDVFLQVWRDSSKYDPDRGDVRSWLIVQLRYRILDTQRGNAIHQRIEESIYKTTSQDYTQLHSSLEYDLIKTHINNLSDQHQEVIQAAYFRNETASEAGQRLGIPSNTVKSRLNRALRTLRNKLAENTHQLPNLP